jgi:hypothetical protein
VTGLSKFQCVITLALVFLFIGTSPGIASPVISNLSLLRQGCYLFTDKLVYAEANEVFTQSTFPDAYLGNSVIKVKCTEPHHLEISTVFKSKVLNSIRLDGIPLKTKCIIGNIKYLNSRHANHKVETYFKVYRIPNLKMNKAICGVLAPHFVHPNNTSYKIYEDFLTPHLNFELLGQK